MAQQKILCIDVNNVRFIDSLSFINAPLSALPKMFGFNELNKGFFPYRYPKPDTNEEIEIPEIEYFEPNFMKPDVRKDFEQWYNDFKNSGRKWHWLTEIVKYCENNVEILAKAIQKYRQIYKETSGLDPITRNFTLASVCLEIYK